MIDIIVAVITGGLAVIAVVVSNRKAAQETTAKIEKSQALTECKLDELTREVREHNNFARRMPVVEEQIKVINHRLDDISRHD